MSWLGFGGGSGEQKEESGEDIGLLPSYGPSWMSGPLVRTNYGPGSASHRTIGWQESLESKKVVIPYWIRHIVRWSSRFSSCHTVAIAKISSRSDRHRYGQFNRIDKNGIGWRVFIQCYWSHLQSCLCWWRWLYWRIGIPGLVGQACPEWVRSVLVCGSLIKEIFRLQKKLQFN